MKTRDKIIVPLVALGLILIVAIIISVTVRYHLIYCPLYSIAGNFFFLAFYIRAVADALFVVLACLIVYMLVKSLVKKEKGIIWSCIIFVPLFIFGAYSFTRDVLNDAKLVMKDKYEVAETSISKVYRHRVAKHKSYSIQINNNTEHRLSLDLNFYQYKKLSSIKREHKNAQIKVYYLPNTKQVLQYEITSIG